ncbi:MAG: hypothetical protein RR655_06890, partial [Raoultibacter sp.]
MQGFRIASLYDTSAPHCVGALVILDVCEEIGAFWVGNLSLVACPLDCVVGVLALANYGEA